MLDNFILAPIYNALVFLLNYSPNFSLWVAILTLTVIIRLVLFPFAKSTILNQRIQKKLQPAIIEIRKKYTDPAEQTKVMMELYKLNKTNPFTGCLLLLIQLPVLLGVFTVFSRDLAAQSEYLYSGLALPSVINYDFFGISLLSTSLTLALLTGIIQFLQLYYSPAMRIEKSNQVAKKGNLDLTPDEMQQKMMAGMQKAMRYILPIMVFFFALQVPAGVALYWFFSTLLMLVQEVLVFKYSKEPELVYPPNLYEKT